MVTFIKDVFHIIFIALLVLLLFYLFFGDISRSFMWSNMEPVFHSNWDMYTMRDGELITNHLNANFNALQEVNTHH